MHIRHPSYNSLLHSTYTCWNFEEMVSDLLVSLYPFWMPPYFWTATELWRCFCRVCMHILFLSCTDPFDACSRCLSFRLPELTVDWALGFDRLWPSGVFSAPGDAGRQKLGSYTSFPRGRAEGARNKPCVPSSLDGVQSESEIVLRGTRHRAAYACQ